MIGICTEESVSDPTPDHPSKRLEIEDHDPSHEYLIHLKNTGPGCLAKTRSFRKYFEYYANGTYGLSSKVAQNSVGLQLPSSEVMSGFEDKVYTPLIYVITGGEWKARNNSQQNGLNPLVPTAPQ